jgi:alkanesulfonate monooxygenase SsuD/methylene tetrahydromethanopterin reductase-like flavin-dependent oxidoreductase (luciferase family)
MRVGTGYRWPQYPVLEVDMETTWERLDESLDVVLAAWRPEEFDHRGAFYEFRRHGCGRSPRGHRGRSCSMRRRAR